MRCFFSAKFRSDAVDGARESSIKLYGTARPMLSRLYLLIETSVFLPTHLVQYIRKVAERQTVKVVSNVTEKPRASFQLSWETWESEDGDNFRRERCGKIVKP